MPSKADDARVNELVCECIERMDREGERVLEVLCAAHPELAERLRRRIGALLQSGMLELSQGAADEAWPERVGDFRLLRKLGEGGKIGRAHV